MLSPLLRRCCLTLTLLLGVHGILASHAAAQLTGVSTTLDTTAPLLGDPDGQWISLIVDGQPQPGTPSPPDWNIEGGALQAQPGAGPWLMRPPGPSMINPVLSATFTEPTEIQATLLIRGQLRRGKPWSGLGLRLRGRHASLVAIRRGKLKVLDRFRFRSFYNRAQVEVTLRLLGDLLLVTARDAGRDIPLGAGLLRGDRVTGATGDLVGLIPTRRWSGGISALRVRQTCQPAPAASVLAEDTPMVFRLPKRDVANATYGYEVGEAKGGSVLFLTSPGGLEAHHCKGRAIGPLEAYSPWTQRDPRYHSLTAPDRARLAEDPMLDLGYSDPEMVERTLEGLARRYPRHARKITLGRSHNGRPISALLIANDLQALQSESRPSILINGGHHGNELLSIDFALDVTRQLLTQAAQGPSADPRFQRWLSTYAIWCVPLVNPDGNYAYLTESSAAGRKNRRDVNGDGRLAVKEGVDLNRNYPFRWGALGERGSRSDPQSVYYRGRAPASEPEVQALMKLVDQERFAVSLSFHTGAVAVLTPYTIEGNPPPSPDVAAPLAEAMATAIGEHPQGHTVPVLSNLYAVDGVDQDWMMYTYGTIAMLIEGALWTPIDPEARAAIIESIRPAWAVLLDRLIDGPTLSGQITDAAGRPVGARVEIEEITAHNGERWHARCRDGRFDRLLPAPGRYTLKITAPGQPPLIEPVEVTGHTTVNIALPRPVKSRCPSPRR